MKCPKCGTDNPSQARFCMSCAAPLVTTCEQCGTELPPAARFCLHCGAPITPIPAIDADQASRSAIDQAIRRLIPKEYAERLQATRGQPHDERRTVTILFSDVKGSTAMAEKLDPEDVKEVMAGVFEFLIAPIYRYEGTLAQLMGDAILAFFGAPIAHEDDPERACRAGLEITAEARKYAAKLEKERGITGFNVRVGINTGLVVMGEVGSDLRVEYTATGDAINLAARMEQNAPPGGILITHDTYRHIRGVFDVAPQEPLLVKGKSERVLTYLVERAKPRAFRLETRGVEGIETRTIGREAELHCLQDAYFDAVETSETRAVIVTGDAGVGKSRLLYEFLNWAELRPEHFYLFKGRARAETRVVPYAVLRDLFINRFEILETDSAHTALAKFRAGMSGFLEPDRADLVGQLVGFDFSASQAVSNLLGSPSFVQLATAYLLQYLRTMVGQQPVVIVLEDLHWADDSSLDLVDNIITQMPRAKLLLVCLARQALFERRPSWGEGRDAYVLLPLKALSRRLSRALVAEILQRVNNIPSDLSDLIVDGAEGNPFYVEELIKMLLEEGAIVRGEDSWRVELRRLRGLRVPPTLTGVLQARLDSLPLEAREVLQRASVVGRVFWDGAVAALAADDAPPVADHQLHLLLDTVRERELVFRREQSAFASAQEYIFKHLILHDVTYESVLLKVRKVYHQQVAQWLETHAAERVAEYAGLIAEHYERAGEALLAAHWLQRVADAAIEVGAFRASLAAAERGLALLPEEEKATRADLLLRVGHSHTYLGNYSAAREQLQASVTLARECGALRTAALALGRLANMAYHSGAFDEMEPLARQALALAQSSGDAEAEALAVSTLGIAALSYRQDADLAVRYLTESLALRRQRNDKPGMAASLMSLGEAARSQGDYRTARRYYEETLALARETGNWLIIPTCLFNLAEVEAAQNNHTEATRHYEEALAIANEIGLRRMRALCLGGLGYGAVAQGEWQSAQHRLCQALSEGNAIGSAPSTLYALVGLARLEAQRGNSIPAAEWLGLVLSHAAASETDVQQRAQPLLAELRLVLPSDQLETSLARGAALQFDTVVARILDTSCRGMTGAD